MKKNTSIKFIFLLFIFSNSLLFGPQQIEKWISIDSDFPQKPVMAASTMMGSSIPQTILKSNGSIDFSFSLPGYFKTDSVNQGMKILRLPDGYSDGSFGSPIIPFYEIHLALPPNAEIDFVEIIFDDFQIENNIELDINRPFTITPKGIAAAEYEKVKIEKIFPEKVYRIIISKMKDGNSDGTLFIYPIQYDQQNKQCTIHKKLELSIHFSFRGYSQKEFEEFFGSKILNRAKGKFGTFPKLKKGQRNINYDVLAETEKGKVYKNSFLVEQDGGKEFSIIAMSHWFNERNGEVEKNLYGVQTYNGSEDFPPAYSKEKTSFEIKSDLEKDLSQIYKKTHEIKHEDDIFSLVDSEWDKSPGLILFKRGDIDSAVALTPLASYLNWPLIGIDTPNDFLQVKNLFANLNCRFIILGGLISDEFGKQKIFPGVVSICLDNQDEINQFAVLQKSSDQTFNKLYQYTTVLIKL